MTFIAEPEIDADHQGDKEDKKVTTEQPVDKVVFRSFSTAEDLERLMPESAQASTSKELDSLEVCCKATEVTPRSGKRLVNVFKLMKIIWFHRGPQREPDDDAKRGIILLLALAAAQPVIMREVLRDLDSLLRRAPEPTKTLTAVLWTQIQKHQAMVNSRTFDLLTAVLAEDGLFSAAVSLKTLGLDNLRLVRSFSFVGETADEFDAPKEKSPAAGGNAKTRDKKASG